MMRARCSARIERRRVSRHAFTLVELIVVLVIISAVAGLALPAYGSALARYRLDAAAYDLSRELDRAATHARATSTTVTIRFDTTNHVVGFDDLPERITAATSFAF
ncbi:MAG: prepilin-type N-terminal cleavage/methylation domain-containing protein, partial [Planctomycetota bacterium]